ncbi:MAG: TetR/AcrR family transcriptional regulator [Proteobacteria bacterium]|nr:TetR/AcrR family transcriptional regulator [Pseudomonadota bacterium]
MSYIAERRVEEKERRRGEILDSAVRLYAEKGWDAVTMDQVARSARLSRALLYVYFRDKEELLYGIGAVALSVLREHCLAAVARSGSGLEQVEAIGRAYMAYAQEYPHYFDVCARFQAHSVSPDPGSNEGACAAAGDEALGVVVTAIRAGLADGSIRQGLGDPMLLAVSLWAFTHGIIQLAMTKARDLEHLQIAVPTFTEYAFGLLTSLTAAPKTA